MLYKQKREYKKPIIMERHKDNSDTLATVDYQGVGHAMLSWGKEESKLEKLSKETNS